MLCRECNGTGRNSDVTCYRCEECLGTGEYCEYCDNTGRTSEGDICDMCEFGYNLEND